MIEFGRW